MIYELTRKVGKNSHIHLLRKHTTADYGIITKITINDSSSFYNQRVDLKDNLQQICHYGDTHRNHL